MKSLVTRAVSGESLALVYLTSPVIIFLCTWLRPPFGILLVGCTLAGLIWYIRGVPPPSPHGPTMEWRRIIPVLIVVVLLTALSGAGGLVSQKPDWAKHNVILNDLMRFDWPVYYGSTDVAPDTTLVYYIAYYLPSAIAGKVSGWVSANAVMFVWTFLGMMICAGLLMRDRRWTWVQLVFFFLVSGADILGVFATQIFSPHPLPFTQLEQYANGLQYSSPMTQLLWVPQHAIPSWIGTLLGLQLLNTDRLKHNLLFLIGVVLYWSPFAAIGLSLLYLPYFLAKRFAPYLTLQNITGAVISALVLLYYGSVVSPHRHMWDLYITSGPDILGNIGLYVSLLVLDVMLIGIVVALLWSKFTHQRRTTVAWAFALLCLIPLVRFGSGPDFVMRASIPALTLVFVTLATHVHEILRMGRTIMVVSCAVLLLGVCTPIVEVVAVFAHHAHAVNEQPLDTLPHSYTRYKVLYKQYLGRRSALFGQTVGNYPLLYE